MPTKSHATSEALKVHASACLRVHMCPCKGIAQEAWCSDLTGVLDKDRPPAIVAFVSEYLAHRQVDLPLR